LGAFRLVADYPAISGVVPHAGPRVRPWLRSSLTAGSFRAAETMRNLVTLMTGRLVLLCGRSFSGKSTVAASLADSLPGQVMSLDQINEERGLHGGEGIPLSEWA